TLKRSDTRTITVTTKFSATGTAFTNTANVTFGTQTGGLTGGTSSDPNLGNNSATVATTVNP
ncbi:MAG TPA: hypothetical protein VGL91_04290, partial [Acidobacteriota bacterium]